MSRFEGLTADVAGVILVGAEGCAETEGVSWMRDPTAEEMDGFKDYCRGLSIRQHGRDRKFDFTEWTLDGTGRPYWLKVVMVTPETPTVALRKAVEYTRALRVHVDY